MSARPAAVGPNLVELAVRDLTTAAAVLRKPGSGVVALDVRDLAGGAQALATGPRAFDVYCAAIDAGLGRMRGLGTRGYRLVRRAA